MTDYQTLLMQKNGLVIIHLAQKLLAKQEGDKMDTIISIAEELKVGRGTVQTALKNLQSFKALDFETKGHKGSIITQIDYDILMRISGIKSLVGVMPLPYSKRYEGLATGLYKSLNNGETTTSLAFMSGAERRVGLLLDGRYDFCIMSKMSAYHYISEHMPITIIAQLGDHSYVNDHTLIVRKNEVGYKPGMRIGVDYSSYDQVDMTVKYFKDKQIEFVPIKYNQILEGIKSGFIDGSIWSLEENVLKDVELECLDIHTRIKDLDNTQAVIVTRNNEVGIQNYFKRFFKEDVVAAIQKDVILNKIMPNY